MMDIAAIEACGAAAAAVAAVLAFRATKAFSADSRFTFVGLMLIVCTIHLLDVAEWLGNDTADRYGDILKVLTPAAWLFFLFVATRDELLGRVEAQSQQLDFFLGETPVALAVVDRAGRYVRCSRRWRELHDLDHLVPGALLASGTGDLLERWERCARACMQASTLARARVRKADAEGREHFFECEARPWRVGGEIAGAFILVREVTRYVHEQEERERGREHVLRMQQREELFEVACGVAHDLNNLLSVIGMHTDLLSEPADEQSVQESLQVIGGAVASAGEMTRGLLSLGDRPRPQPERLELGAEVEAVARFVRPLVSERIELMVEAPDKPYWALVGGSQVQQLVLNLMVNARDAMPEGGVLKVVVSHTEQGPRLKVSDTGSGIPEELQKRIFEPFFTTKRDAGTGLGLAIVRRVVSDCGAQMALESAVERGTCFTITFISAPAARGAPKVRAAAGPSAKLQSTV